MRGPTMAGSSPSPRETKGRAIWPRQLRRGAAWLAGGAILYWMAFALGGRTLWVKGLGVVYVDLLMAWIGVLLNLLAWPDLWDGLKGLVVAHPGNPDALVARRSFFMVLGLMAFAVVALPLQYRVVAPTGVWMLILYITAFPYLAWLFIPTLALYGILFGRVGNLLTPTAKHLTDAGAVVLFSVAAATTAIVLRTPASTVFVESWSVGFGALPAAASAAYVLIGIGISHRPLPQPKPTRGWALAKTPRAKEPVA